MPLICRFYGIDIRLFYNDHGKPHFHVQYGEFQATVLIESGDVLEGHLPARALAFVREWLSLHRIELGEAWTACREKRQPGRIEPLE